MWLTESEAADATPLAPVRRASGVLLRGAVYVIIALAVFFVVTLITSFFVGQ